MYGRRLGAPCSRIKGHAKDAPTNIKRRITIRPYKNKKSDQLLFEVKKLTE